MNIEQRGRRLVNTDPLRRCYNECHFSSKLVWMQWQVIEYNVTKDRINFWRELNDCAVRDRGESALVEYRLAD